MNIQKSPVIFSHKLLPSLCIYRISGIDETQNVLCHEKCHPLMAAYIETGVGQEFRSDFLNFWINIRIVFRNQISQEVEKFRPKNPAHYCRYSCVKFLPTYANCCEKLGHFTNTESYFSIVKIGLAFKHQLQKLVCELDTCHQRHEGDDIFVEISKHEDVTDFRTTLSNISGQADHHAGGFDHHGCNFRPGCNWWCFKQFLLFSAFIKFIYRSYFLGENFTKTQESMLSPTFLLLSADMDPKTWEKVGQFSLFIQYLGNLHSFFSTWDIFTI